ncbi:hypothetical protein K440DRAFT_628048 [Wilcoxina mikolae CBS 423.85]|nr:hypothetical protein K440DRAFT_628048 [Wilcoxina mikolae CBS 423.85]
MHHHVLTTSRLITTSAKSLSGSLLRLTNPAGAVAIAHEQQQLTFPSSSLIPNTSTTANTMFPMTLRRLARPPSLTLLTPRSSRTYNSSSRSPSDGSSSSRGAPPPRILESSRRNTTSGVPFVPSTGHLRPSDIALSTFFALHRPINIPPATAAAPPPTAPRDALPEAWDLGIPFCAPPPPTSSGEMSLISVKRQRRLKMKKHKYKKLMKKTRNLRRRIERQKN